MDVCQHQASRGSIEPQNIDQTTLFLTSHIPEMQIFKKTHTSPKMWSTSSVPMDAKKDYLPHQCYGPLWLSRRGIKLILTISKPEMKDKDLGLDFACPGHWNPSCIYFLHSIFSAAHLEVQLRGMFFAPDVFISVRSRTCVILLADAALRHCLLSTSQ